MDIRNLYRKEKKALHIDSVRRSTDNWKFCNTELKSKTGYCSD